jgi:hypothetical protein
VSQVLDASCAVSPKTCGAVMDYYASQIVENTNCGLDYEAGNPTVVAALTGLQNYLIYYEAGCLRDNSTNIYCISPPKSPSVLTKQAIPWPSQIRQIPLTQLLTTCRLFHSHREHDRVVTIAHVNSSPSMISLHPTRHWILARTICRQRRLSISVAERGLSAWEHRS